MTIQHIDQIVGNYQTNSHGLPENLKNLVVSPPRNEEDVQGNIVLFFDNGQIVATRAEFSFSGGEAQANLTAEFLNQFGEVYDIEIALTFHEPAEGIHSFSGTAKEGKVGVPAAKIEILGVNTNMVVNQKHLDEFKDIFPDDASIQAVHIGDVLHYSTGAEIDGRHATLDPVRGEIPITRKRSLTDCILSCAAVVIDVVLLVAMAAPLAKIVFGSGNATTKVALLIERVGSQRLVSLVEEMRNASGGMEKASVAWKLIKSLSALGIVKKVIGAITSVLSWWDWVLFGLTILGTIIAALATAGVALIARVALLIVSVASLITDVVKAVHHCSDSQTT